MKKILLSVFVILFVLLLISFFLGMRYFNNMWFKEQPLYSSFTTDFKAIPFIWSENTFGDYVEKQNALLIPVQLEGIPTPLYFQFDTGAPSTLIYGNTLASLKESGVEYTIIEKEGKQFVQELNVDLEQGKLTASILEIMEDYGREYDANDTTSILRLGTIGADFLDQNITAIDFKNEVIQQFAERQDWMTRERPFQTFSFKGRRLMLPSKIAGKKLDLFYDSGSSAFGLITTKGAYNHYGASSAKEIFLDANNWGNALPIRHKASDEKLDIGGTMLPLKRVSYVDMYARFQWIMGPFTPIDGWLGNKPFTEHCLVLDAKMEEFVVVER